MYSVGFGPRPVVGNCLFRTGWLLGPVVDWPAGRPAPSALPCWSSVPPATAVLGSPGRRKTAGSFRFATAEVVPGPGRALAYKTGKDCSAGGWAPRRRSERATSCIRPGTRWSFCLSAAYFAIRSVRSRDGRWAFASDGSMPAFRAPHSLGRNANLRRRRRSHGRARARAKTVGRLVRFFLFSCLLRRPRYFSFSVVLPLYSSFFWLARSAFSCRM